MFTRKIFNNKVRLITIPSKDTQAVTVLFLFGVGSRYESKQINGASHFLEHLMFKGTKKRPSTLAISRELDSVGAEFNAMTSKDYTGYYIKINKDKLELAIDILSDMLLNSVFKESEINRERGVIVEEINMYHDNPLMGIESEFEQEVFKGNTLSYDVAGPASVIKNISRRQLLDYKQKHYRPDNVVVAVAGKFDAGVNNLIQKYFVDKLKSVNHPKEEFAQFILRQKQTRVRIKYKNTKQMQLALGFPAFGLHDDRKYVLNVLSVILGGNMSSRLFINVRERKGLAYFVRCYPNYYQDTGNIMIQAGLDPARKDEAVQVILDELRKVKKRGVTAKELKDSVEFLNGKTVLNLEDSSHLAEFYAKQELLNNKILTPSQKLRKFKAVTRNDIKKVANEVFRDELLTVAGIGPINKINI